MSVTGLGIFIFVFSVAVVMSVLTASERNGVYIEKCKAAGGYPYAPRGTKGHPSYICLNSDAIIKIERDES